MVLSDLLFIPGDSSPSHNSVTFLDSSQISGITGVNVTSGSKQLLNAVKINADVLTSKIEF